MAEPKSKFVITAEDRATATLRKVSAEFGGLGAAASRAAALMTTFGGALSIGAAVAAVKSVADLQDRMGKLSQQVGIGVEALTELDYAAKLSDVSTEDLATGVTRLTSKMADVAQGSKEAAAVFDSLGVKVKKHDGTLRSSEDVLKDIAQRFSEFADGSTKTAYAVEIFGRSGAKLIPMLNAGRAGLADLAEEARRLGVVFDEKAAKAAEEFNDNLTRLGQAAQGLKIELLQGLIPGLTEITQRFLDARAAGLAFGDALDIAANIKGFGTLDEKIADVQRRLNDARTGKWTSWFSNDVKGLQAELEKLLALRRKVDARETTRHPAGFSTALFGPGREVGAEPPKLRPTRPTTPAARLSQADLTYQQKAVIDAATGYDKASRAAEVFALKLQVLDAKFFEHGGSVEDYTAAVQELTKATETAGTDGVGALEDLANGWLDNIDPMRAFLREIEQVEQALARGLISEDQAAAIKRRMADALEPISEADAWAVEAAKNIQDHLGQSMFDVLDGNFDNIGKSFSTMLKRMVAEAMAANLARDLFGDFGKTGKIGGWAGTALSWLAGSFGGGLSMRPSHATGLDYVPYDGYIARLHRGERVLTATENRGGAAAPSVTVSPQITINGEMTRSQEARLATMMRNVAIATMADQRRRSFA